MLFIRIHNDGKEKHQSFEAWIEGCDCEKGYGHNADEAVLEFKNNLEKITLRMQLALRDLKLNNFETVKVNCLGEEI